MEAFLGQFLLLLFGLIIELGVPLFLSDDNQKRFVRVLGLIFIAAALLWAGIKIGQREIEETPTPSPTATFLLPSPTPAPPSPTPVGMSIQSTGTGGLNHWLIVGPEIGTVEINDELVVYGFRQNREVPIGLLQVVSINPDTITGQAHLVHPDILVEPNLRVDTDTTNLSTSELVPAFDLAVGYLLEPGRVRLKPDTQVSQGATLQFLIPLIVDEAITDYQATALVRVTDIGVEGNIAFVELVDDSQPWPSVGTILQSREGTLVLPESHCGGESFIPPAFDASLFDSEFGLTRYNAFNDMDGANGKRNNSIHAVTVVDNGIWVGFEINDRRGGVSFFQANNADSIWEPCPATEVLVNDIARASNGDIWVATDGDWVWRLQGATWSQFTLADGFPSRSTYAILAVNNQLLIASFDGIATFNGTSWLLLHSRNNGSLLASSVHSLAQATDGSLWIGYIEAGLSHLMDQTRTDFTLENGNLSSNRVRDMILDQQGRVWIATHEAGIAVYDGSSWQKYTVENSDLPSDFVTALALDKYNRVWAGTDSGTSYFDGESWQFYMPFYTLDIAFGTSNCDDCRYNNDHVWIGTRGSGLTHGRLPPASEVVIHYDVQDVPAILAPGAIFSPTIIVELEPGYQLQEGDALMQQSGNYGSHPLVPFASYVVQQENSYSFDFGAFPEPYTITAPQEPGTYTSRWRLWQAGRYVGPVITIEFVVSNP